MLNESTSSITSVPEKRQKRRTKADASSHTNITEHPVSSVSASHPNSTMRLDPAQNDQRDSKTKQARDDDDGDNGVEHSATAEHEHQLTVKGARDEPASSSTAVELPTLPIAVTSPSPQPAMSQSALPQPQLKKVNLACHFCDHPALRPYRTKEKAAVLINCQSPKCKRHHRRKRGMCRPLPFYANRTLFRSVLLLWSQAA